MTINWAPWFQAGLYSRLWWVRIGGRGLHLKDTRVHPLLFSERAGHGRRWQIGPWSIRVLA